MRFGRKLLAAAFVIGAASIAPAMLSADSARVILLGSPTPLSDLPGCGPSIAVVVNGKAYLFDAGAQVVRAAEAAAEKFRIPALQAPSLSRLFLTRLGSPYTLGYPDVMLTPWVVGRAEPLEVYGPQGAAAMTESLRQAYSADIRVRTEGLEELSRRALTINVHEIAKGGVVYRAADISVRALARRKSELDALGYGIEAGGRKIVIGGSDVPSAAIIQACRKCDVLFYETGDNQGATAGAEGRDLVDLASKAKPKLLVLCGQPHAGGPGGLELTEQVRRAYGGKVAVGREFEEY